MAQGQGESDWDKRQRLADELRQAQSRYDQAALDARLATNRRQTERGGLETAYDFLKQRVREIAGTSTRSEGAGALSAPSDAEEIAKGKASFAKGEVDRITKALEVLKPYVQKDTAPQQGPERPPPAPSQDVPAPESAPSRSFDVEGYSKAMSAVRAPAPTATAQPPWEGDTVDTYRQQLMDEAAGGQPTDEASAFAEKPSYEERAARSEAKRYEEITHDFITRYGMEPTRIKKTGTGELFGSFNERDAMRAAHNAQTIRISEESQRLAQINAGGGPAERMQASKEENARLIESMREQARASDAQLKASAAETKAQDEFRYDTADINALARSNRGSPATKAFADYVDAKAQRLPTDGLGEDALKLAQQGASELMQIDLGVDEKGAMGGGIRGAEGVHRNRKKHMVNALSEISADLDKVQKRKLTTQTSQIPGAEEAPPVQLPANPAIPGQAGGPAGAYQQSMGREILANPVAAERGPGVGQGVLGGLAQFIGTAGTGGFGPTYHTSQMGFLPTTPGAVQQLRSVLKRSDPLGAAAAQLMFGLGSDKDRQRLLDYIVQRTGMDPNQYIMRQSIYGDPKWKQMVEEQVIGQLQRFPSQGAAK